MGPTASGKTDLAIALAEALDLAVLSVDSRQLYRGMDVGTAKPTAAQRARVRHELIDLRDPDQPINLQEFLLLAREAIAEEHRRRGVALLVGGSGLYLEALVRGLTPPAVPPQPVLRAQLQSLGQPLCHGLLMQADPEAGRRIAAADAVRTQRALEVIYATGRPRSGQGGHRPPPWRVLELGLDPGDLSERIARRTRLMYATGLIEETEALLNRFGADCPLLRTMGYDEARRLLAGELEPEAAIALTTLRTRRYAKRQRTWFRGHHQPLWLVGALKARGTAASAGRTSAAPDRDPKDQSIRQESPAGSQPHPRSAMQAIASNQIHRSDPIPAAAQHRAAARDMASAQGGGPAQGVGSELGPASTRDGAPDRPMRADPEMPTDQRGGQDRAQEQTCCDPGSGLDLAVSPDANKLRALEKDAEGGDGGEVLRKILQVAHKVLG